jgi:hypothetical protein
VGRDYDGTGTTYHSSCHAARVLAGVKPQRAGPDPTTTNAALQDSIGQLTDSGVPLHAYNGDNASEDLQIEVIGADGDVIEIGDAVGDVYWWDDDEKTGIGTTVGLPSTVRDGGISGNASNNVTDADLWRTISGSGQDWTIVVRLDLANDTGNILIERTNTGGAGIRIRKISNQRAQIRAFDSTGSLMNGTSSDNGSASPGVQTWVCSYRASVPRLRLEVYDASDVKQGATNSVTLGFAEDFTTDHDVGLAGNIDDVVVEIYDTDLITAGISQDVVDGTNPTGDDSRVRNMLGMRTGVIDSADSTRLIHKLGTGADVTAEEV